jgi:hypothetical protein
MMADAELVRGKMHTHNTIFKESYFFAGTPEQLGMDKAHFHPKNKVYDVIDPIEMGFENIGKILNIITIYSIWRNKIIYVNLSYSISFYKKLYI